VNFEPERWPMGDGPGYGRDETEMPDYESLQENTFSAFGDLDASPTKAWVVTHRHEQPAYFEFAVGRRPGEEFYDISADPHCMKNLADEPNLAEIKASLRDRLMNELRRTGDPRVSDQVIFEAPPFTDAGEPNRGKKAANQRRKAD
jgi:uncharacterized sulfatase